MHMLLWWMTTTPTGPARAVDAGDCQTGEGFGLGFAVRMQLGVTPVPGSPGMYYWSGMAGTTFFVDPSEELFAILMIQAPNQRGHYRQLFRTMVYASLID